MSISVVDGADMLVKFGLNKEGLELVGVVVDELLGDEEKLLRAGGELGVTLVEWMMRKGRKNIDQTVSGN